MLANLPLLRKATIFTSSDQLHRVQVGKHGSHAPGDESIFVVCAERLENTLKSLFHLMYVSANDEWEQVGWFVVW